MALPKLKPTSTLPAILAVVGMYDSGEYGNASCPHCGADGRYVWYFLCEDGVKRGAMSGCIQLFPETSSRYSKLVQEAFNRQTKAKEERKNLATWWREMVDAAEEFGAGAPYGDHAAIQDNLVKMQQKVAAAEGRRQEWLTRNGYSRQQYRGRR